MKKYRVGYTAGVYDLFHHGHLNILRSAKEQCDYLIVAVNTDELVYSYKNKYPIVSHHDRMDIIGSLRCVDQVVENRNLDKLAAWDEFQFNAVFIGDDWKGSERWKKAEADLKAVGVDVVYIPYTLNISSTVIRNKLLDNE